MGLDAVGNTCLILPNLLLAQKAKTVIIHSLCIPETFPSFPGIKDRNSKVENSRANLSRYFQNRRNDSISFAARAAHSLPQREQQEESHVQLLELAISTITACVSP